MGETLWDGEKWVVNKDYFRQKLANLKSVYDEQLGKVPEHRRETDILLSTLSREMEDIKVKIGDTPGTRGS